MFFKSMLLLYIMFLFYAAAGVVIVAFVVMLFLLLSLLLLLLLVLVQLQFFCYCYCCSGLGATTVLFCGVVSTTALLLQLFYSEIKIRFLLTFYSYVSILKCFLNRLLYIYCICWFVLLKIRKLLAFFDSRGIVTKKRCDDTSIVVYRRCLSFHCTTTLLLNVSHRFFGLTS